MSKNVQNRRVDQWLFYTRLTKSRSLAGRLIEAGKVRVNKTKITKPAHTIISGDVITAMINHNLKVVKVLDLGHRRGPAAEAQLLYQDMTPQPEPLKKGRLFGVSSPSRPKGAGRPTKKDRRKIDSLKQITD